MTFPDDRWVDLGLPSGILWAAYNVGATSPEEYGGYYAWGETEEKDTYEIKNYTYAKFRGYNEHGHLCYDFIDIGNNITGTTYDVAHVKWGDGARMPTKNEFSELYNNCSFELGINNQVKGYFVTGPNKKSIFIPLAGVNCDGLDEVGHNGIYWASTCEYEGYPDSFCINTYRDAEIFIDTEHGYCGFSIRPVKDKPKEEQ